MVQRQQRAIQHIGAKTTLDLLRTTQQTQGCTGQQRIELRRRFGQVAQRDRTSDQQPGMQATIGHRVGRRELPVGQMRLHDLETGRDPSDRIEQLLHRRVRRGRGAHAEHRFRFDPWLAGYPQ